MKKFFNVLLTGYALIAEIIGSFIILMFVLSLFGAGKFEVSHGNWSRCFGNCEKPAKEIQEAFKTTKEEK